MIMVITLYFNKLAYVDQVGARRWMQREKWQITGSRLRFQLRNHQFITK